MAIRECYLIKYCREADFEIYRMASRINFIAYEVSGQMTKNIKNELAKHGELNKETEASANEFTENNLESIKKSDELLNKINNIIRDKKIMYQSLFPKRTVFYDGLKGISGERRAMMKEINGDLRELNGLNR
jgi:hypothetical protein